MELPNIIIEPIEPMYIPKRATDGSSGYDLVAAESVELYVGDRALVSVGFKVELPIGYRMIIVPRSGLANKHGILIPNSPGTVDSDYRGTVKVGLLNTGDETFYVTKGMRIAQCYIEKDINLPYKIGKVDETVRGEGGFGSTGT